jgi:hypothetical protein
MPEVKMDEEMKVFAADVLESIAQAKRGEFGHVHTPADIAGYKARGRRLGSSKDDAKQAVTVRYSPDMLVAVKILLKQKGTVPFLK